MTRTKFFILCCLFFGTFIIVGVTSEEGTECVVGQTTKKSCNHCFCANGYWACTLIRCLDDDGVTTEQAAKCVPGETKQILCNYCFCSYYGHWACTRKGC